MKPVGYLINTKQGQEGETGLFFNYVLAGNGLYIQASGPLIRASVCIADAEVRGLNPLEERLELVRGKIPRYIYDLAVSGLCANPSQERYLAVTWEGQYRLRAPVQESSASSVTYNTQESTILDIHSHGTMKPFFSYTDTCDEQGLRLYMVVGHLDHLIPEVKMRVGVYGYFMPVNIEEVFGV